MDTDYLVYVVVTSLIKFLILVLAFIMPLASILTWMERRQSAFMQDRLGPHRAHFLKWPSGKPFALQGLLHIAADGLKMFFKEPFMPRGADKLVFQIAPAIGFISSLLIFSMIPVGPDIHTGWNAPWDVIPLQVTHLDTGILFVFALGSLGIYGTALAGWSSNNRFALLGGLRASAQSISYEIALGLTVVGMLMVCGSTELTHIVAEQSNMTFHGLLPRWGIFVQPLGAVLFLVAAIAETKRGPFDLPEGESEIIGYFVEYSSMGFGLFMLGEFVEIVTLGALFTTVFLGGWSLPYIVGDHSVYLGFTEIELGSWAMGGVGALVFGIKVFLLCAFQLHLRWTLPRFRYDQLMHLGWKGLLPLALVNIFVSSLLIWWDPTLEILSTVGVAMITLFLLVVIAGPRRTPVHAHAGHAAPAASH